MNKFCRARSNIKCRSFAICLKWQFTFKMDVVNFPYNKHVYRIILGYKEQTKYILSFCEIMLLIGELCS